MGKEKVTNEQRVIAAAIDLLGTQGLRALTHLRIDEAAGLPRGSTSNVFRTRAALLAGVANAIVATDIPGDYSAFNPTSGEELIEDLANMLDVVAGPARTVIAARLVLLVEQNVDVEIGKALGLGRAQLIDLILPVLQRLGAEDPNLAAETIASCMEGLILHRMARHDQSDPRPILRTVVRAVLEPASRD